MPRTTDEDLEEMVDLQIRKALERELPPPEPQKPSDLTVLTEEIRNFASKVSEAVARPPEVVVSPPTLAAAPNAELMEVLTEMRQSNRTLANALSKPPTAFPVSPPSIPPIVHVAAPSVNLSPQVTMERPTRWRFTVTKRDQNNQGRIQEIVAEPY